MSFLRSIGCALAALLAIAVATAPAAAQQRGDEAAIAFALERGRLLFDLDRAAWVGTDDMVAQVSGWREAGMRGYVVERDGTGYRVVFFGGPEAAPVAHYVGRVENHRVVSREVFAADRRPPLTAAQQRLVAARTIVAGGTSRRACGTHPFNTAVVPPATPGGPIDVYLMTPQVEDGEFPLGGHFRATVDSEGRVVSERAFTNSCLTMPRPPSDAAALMVSHLLDRVPTEIHVFTAMSAGVPVYVAIARPQRVYVVTGEAIRRVRR
jgi:hypothetical protein